MSIQLFNPNSNRPAFKARVKLMDADKTVEGILASAIASTGSTGSTGSTVIGAASGIASTTSAASTASNLLGSGAGIIGSAFSAKAIGLNSSGIVPVVINAAAPYATPATIASANAHPAIMGSLFSGVGALFHKLGGFVKGSAKVKMPSKEAEVSKQEQINDIFQDYKSKRNRY